MFVLVLLLLIPLLRAIFLLVTILLPVGLKWGRGRFSGFAQEVTRRPKYSTRLYYRALGIKRFTILDS